MGKLATGPADQAGATSDAPRGPHGPRGSASPPDAFFRSVVEGMRCAILTLDRDGRATTMNRMAREILEIDEPTDETPPVQELLARHPRLAEVLLASLEMSHPPNRAEMELRTREDDGRTIGFTISPIVDACGEHDGIALFFKDLTQVERQEEQDRLRDRLAALGQMAASMAHELRNPLASIEVTATLLRRRLEKQGEDVSLLEKITSEVQRLNRTVTQGLEFARPVAPERTQVPVSEILDAAWEEARHRFPGAEIELVRRYDPAVPAVLVDAQLMRQVFVNLISNAVEAMEGRGTLTLSTLPTVVGDAPPAAVDVVVLDTGPGITEDVRQKIFYPFVTTKKDGSGIGLAMARKIVECHHGWIDVADAPEGGTLFRLRLPCAPAGDTAVT